MYVYIHIYILAMGVDYPKLTRPFVTKTLAYSRSTEPTSREPERE